MKALAKKSLVALWLPCCLFWLLMGVAYAATESESIVTTLTEYGLLGVIVIALGWYVLNMQKRYDAQTLAQNEKLAEVIKGHKDERDEWREQFVLQNDRTFDITEKSTAVMSELKTTLDSIDKSIRSIEK